MDAAWGIVYPASPEQMMHKVPLRSARYAKVQVDAVLDLYHNHPLPIPVNDEISTLYQATGTFIQWPKEDIFVLAPDPTEVALAPHTP